VALQTEQSHGGPYRAIFDAMELAPGLLAELRVVVSEADTTIAAARRSDTHRA